MQHDDTCQGVGAIHERCRPFDDFGIVHAVGIHLNAVLVAPLVALLAYAVVYHDESVEAQSAYHGLGYAASGGYL